MKTRRFLLYSGYKLLKKVGYLGCVPSSQHPANILVFHRVNDRVADSLTTPTKVFVEMMHKISQEYTSTSLHDLVERAKNHKEFAPKSVVVTFDDGYLDNFVNAAPVLCKHNIPATFFVTSGYINTNRVFPWDKETGVEGPLMKWDQVIELSRMGFEIGSHTINHVDLGKVSLEVGSKEILGSKDQIEGKIHKPLVSFAYPFGRKDCIKAELREVVRKAGLECCCSGYGGKVTERSDLYNLYRIPAYPNVLELEMELDNFMTYFDEKMSIHMLGYKQR